MLFRVHVCRMTEYLVEAPYQQEAERAAMAGLDEDPAVLFEYDTRTSIYHTTRLVEGDTK